MKEKIMSIFVTSILAMSLLTGYGTSANDNQFGEEHSTPQTTDPSSTESTTDVTEDMTEPATQNKESGNGRVLVAYYSASGKTEAGSQCYCRVSRCRCI